MANHPKRKGQIPSSDLVPIVGDAAIAGQIAEGVMIPLLILDTTKRPDLTEIIRVHAYMTPGDVVVTWGGLEDDPDIIILVLLFERPIEARAVLSFSIERQGILVEAVLTSGAVYLQAGRAGDRLIHDLDRPKILIELPDTGFRPIWQDLFMGRMTSVLSAQLGISKRRARPHARQLIDQLREHTSFRMPQRLDIKEDEEI